MVHSHRRSHNIEDMNDHADDHADDHTNDHADDHTNDHTNDHADDHANDHANTRANTGQKTSKIVVETGGDPLRVQFSGDFSFEFRPRIAETAHADVTDHADAVPTDAALAPTLDPALDPALDAVPAGTPDGSAQDESLTFTQRIMKKLYF